mmetsp:Transcript_152085/g.488327  ORF Transcript_152085/g.488327 Transcript_152085/m.488327 type:complete len:391 (+) Transcript_152085:330-1502(+)
MEQEMTGVWGATVTLGLNRWERFYIVLDGDKGRVLHPDYPGATKGTLVCGPNAALQGEGWLLDGRSGFESANAAPIAALTPDALACAGGEAGRPGDRYRIRLHVHGKWRTVTWDKLPLEEDLGSLDLGDYYIVGSWNHYDPVLMRRSGHDDGVYQAEVHLPESGAFVFQLLRNRDWGQVLCPSVDRVMEPWKAEVLAPDDNPGLCWLLQGRAEDVFAFEFQRRQDDEGRESRILMWQHLRTETLGKEALLLASLPLFFIAGTWDMMLHPVRLLWKVGGYCHAFLQLGPKCRESFQIFEDGRLQRSFSPSVDDASPYKEYAIEGPHAFSKGSRCWTLGADPRDEAHVGGRFEIRLRLTGDGRPSALDWIGPFGFAEGLEDAKGRGAVILGK